MTGRALERTSAVADEVAILMDSLLDSQIIVLLVNNMERLDESVKEESDGIYNSLGES